jgi:hypothetical protein
VLSRVNLVQETTKNKGDSMQVFPIRPSHKGIPNQRNKPLFKGQPKPSNNIEHIKKWEVKK